MEKNTIKELEEMFKQNQESHDFFLSPSAQDQFWADYGKAVYKRYVHYVPSNPEPVLASNCCKEEIQIKDKKLVCSGCGGDPSRIIS